MSILRPARSASNSTTAALLWVSMVPERVARAVLASVVAVALAVPWRSVGRQLAEKAGAVMVAAAGWLVAPALGLLVGGLLLVLAANAENVGTLIGLRLAAGSRGDDE